MFCNKNQEDYLGVNFNKSVNHFLRLSNLQNNDITPYSYIDYLYSLGKSKLKENILILRDTNENDPIIFKVDDYEIPFYEYIFIPKIKNKKLFFKFFIICGINRDECYLCCDGSIYNKPIGKCKLSSIKYGYKLITCDEFIHFTQDHRNSYYYYSFVDQNNKFKFILPNPYGKR